MIVPILGNFHRGKNAKYPRAHAKQLLSGRDNSRRIHSAWHVRRDEACVDLVAQGFRREAQSTIAQT